MEPGGGMQMQNDRRANEKRKQRIFYLTFPLICDISIYNTRKGVDGDSRRRAKAAASRGECKPGVNSALPKIPPEPPAELPQLCGTVSRAGFSPLSETHIKGAFLNLPCGMLQRVVCEALPSSCLRDEGFFHPGRLKRPQKPAWQRSLRTVFRFRSKRKGEQVDAVR